ncbi:MAG: SurA N-terminal domain-containing protein [Desulfovibrionaceae bacterium]
MRKTLWPILVLILMCWATGATADVHSIMAVVNGEVITNYDFEQRWQLVYGQIKQRYGDQINSPELQAQLKELRGQLLKQIVDETIIKLEAARLNIQITPEQIDGYEQELKRSNNVTDEEYEPFLKKAGFTRESFRAKLREDIVKRRLVQDRVANRIVITDAEIQEEFETRMGKREGSSGVVNLSVIMVADQAAMDKVREELDNGRTFAEVADEYSNGPAVGAGGELGNFSFEDLAPEWRSALEGVEQGGVSAPFASEGRLVLLKINQSGMGKVDEHSGMREKIYEDLRQKKFEALFEEYMEVLREQAMVEYK